MTKKEQDAYDEAIESMAEEIQRLRSAICAGVLDGTICATVQYIETHRTGFSLEEARTWDKLNQRKKK